MNTLTRAMIENFRARVRTYFFSLYADSYDKMHERGDGSNSMHIHILEYLENIDADKVLDAGCGTGILTQKLKENGYKVMGIDGSKSMLEIAFSKRGLYENCFEQCLETPIIEKFDVVICNSVLQFCESPRLVLKNLSKCLNSRGAIILGLPNKKSIRLLFGDFWRAFSEQRYYQSLLKLGMLLGWTLKKNKFWNIEKACSVLKEFGFLGVETFIHNEWGYLLVAEHSE